MDRRLLLVAGLLLFGTACAYQRAMQKGERLQNQGDWVGAYEAYTTAVDKKPDDPVANAARTAARDRVVTDALATARGALAALQFETAMEQINLAEKLDRDHPDVWALMKEAERAMAAEVARLWESGDARGSYAMAVRARKLFPKAAYLDPTFEQLRSHFSTRAEALLKEKKFEYALIAIRTIAEFEPDRAAAVAPIERRILIGWADDCVSRAGTQARAKRLGAAAALYARAYELAGRREDLAKGQELAATLGTEGKFTVQLTIAGPPTRATPMREKLVAAVAQIKDGAVVSGPGRLTAKLTVAPHKCTETSAVTKAAQEYVSGQVAKPNPVHADLTAQLTAARAEEKAARLQSEKQWPGLQQAEEAARRFDTQLAELERKYAEVKAQADLASQQLEGAKKRRDDLDVEITKAASARSDTRALEAEQAEIEKRLVEWAAAVTTRRDAEDAARRKLEALAAERAPAIENRDRLKAQYEQAVAARTAAQTLAADLATRLAATPPTVMEDVHATFQYDVLDWTRTCTAPVTAAMTPRWKTSLPTSKTFAPANQITDRSHVGLAKAGVQADPKAYPTSDPELVARGDADTAAAIATWFGALADDFYHQKIASIGTALQSDPVGATTSVISLYVGARDRLDPDTIAAFQSHVNAQFGLQKLDLLVGGSPP